MEEIKRQLADHQNAFAQHIADDRHMYDQIHTILRDIKDAQHLVNVNHLPHIESNMGALAKSFADHQIATALKDGEKAAAMAKIATDGEWTKKIMFAVLTVAIAGVGGLFFSLFGKG